MVFVFSIGYNIQIIPMDYPPSPLARYTFINSETTAGLILFNMSDHRPQFSVTVFPFYGLI